MAIEPGELADWDGLVLVGTIVKTHGLRGYVVIHPATDFVEERFRQGARFFSLAAGSVERLEIESVLVHARPVVVFAGHADVEAAQRLVGRELRIREAELQPLPEGSYYHHQLIGCDVVSASGDSIGRVAGVDGGASGSLLRVDGSDGEVLIPLVADICVTIDIADKRIVVTPPDGLLDVNRPSGRQRARRSGRDAVQTPE